HALDQSTSFVPMAKQSTLRSWRRQKRFAMELRLPQSAQLRWGAMCRQSTLGEDRWTKLATILLRQDLGAQPQWAAWHSLAISKLQGTNCRTARSMACAARTASRNCADEPLGLMMGSEEQALTRR